MRVDYKHPAAAKIKIFLNNQDVTQLTVEADNNDGWVDMVVRDVNDKVILDEVTKQPVLVRVYGRVAIRIDMQWRCLHCGCTFSNAADWASHLITPHIVGN